MRSNFGDRKSSYSQKPIKVQDVNFHNTVKRTVHGSFKRTQKSPISKRLRENGHSDLLFDHSEELNNEFMAQSKADRQAATNMSRMNNLGTTVTETVDLNQKKAQTFK